MKKLVSLLIIFILCFTLTPNVASAAVKISKSNVTVIVGKTTTLKISGTTKAVKWSSNNKKVATITSKGKITAVAVGGATVTAIVNKKKYICKVTVNNGFNAKTASKNIGAEFTETNDGIVGILTNKNKYAITITATMIFYDESSLMVGKTTSNNYYFESGKKCALIFPVPYDSDYTNKIEYSSYKLVYSVSNLIDSIKSNLSDIKTESNIAADSVMVEVTNSGSKSPDYTVVSIVFYKEGNIIGYDYQFAAVQEPGSVGYLEFNFPYDSDYNTIQIDDYKIFINESYYYTS